MCYNLLNRGFKKYCSCRISVGMVTAAEKFEVLLLNFFEALLFILLTLAAEFFWKLGSIIFFEAYC